MIDEVAPAAGAAVLEVTAHVTGQQSRAEARPILQQREGLEPGQVTLHSDNGSPMKGATLKATLDRLGVSASYSRPSVSDDNPYVESLFGTMKTRVGYPKKPFETLEEAQAWVDRFVRWYNEEHRHSALNWVTPMARHTGEDRELLRRREETYRRARRRNPHRWSGNIRNCSPAPAVILNPNRKKHRGRRSCSRMSSLIRSCQFSNVIIVVSG